MTLIVLPLIEREHQATELLFRAVHLEVLLTAILKPGVVQATCIADRHGYRLMLLHLRRIEVSGTEEYRHHVIDAVPVGAGLPVLLAIGIHTMLLQLAVAIRIRIPYLVDVIPASLAASPYGNTVVRGQDYNSSAECHAW